MPGGGDFVTLVLPATHGFSQSFGCMKFQFPGGVHGVDPRESRWYVHNGWLRGIKTYKFPWYLTLVNANQTTGNPRFKSLSITETKNNAVRFGDILSWIQTFSTASFFMLKKAKKHSTTTTTTSETENNILSRNYIFKVYPTLPVSH